EVGVLPTELERVLAANPRQVIHDLIRVLLLELGVRGTDCRIPQISECHISRAGRAAGIRKELPVIGILQAEIINEIVSQGPCVSKRNLSIAGQNVLVELRLRGIDGKYRRNLVEQKTCSYLMPPPGVVRIELDVMLFLQNRADDDH